MVEHGKQCIDMYVFLSRQYPAHNLCGCNSDVAMIQCDCTSALGRVQHGSKVKVRAHTHTNTHLHGQGIGLEAVSGKS